MHTLIRQKFQRRTSVVTKGEMEKYWQKLSLLYVTEESDDPDNPNGIIEHKLRWRSQSKFINEISVITHNNSDLTVFVELSDFMAVLNNRLAKNHRQLAFGMVAKKVRKEGAPSNSLPPPDAPSWAEMDRQRESKCNVVNQNLSYVYTFSAGEANKENEPQK